MMENKAALAGRLRVMIDAYQISQVVSTMAALGIANALASGGQPVEAIADNLGVDRGALGRLLRAAAQIGLVTNAGQNVYELTPIGQLLRSDDPDSIRSWAVHAGQPYMWAAWAHLSQSVKTGRAAFPQVHGTDVWNFRSQHPEQGRIFDEAMAESSNVAAAIFDAFDFPSSGTIVDVGGGYGTLLATILNRRPGLHGVLVEQPAVCERARTTLLNAGLEKRCTVVAGNFFEPAPKSGDIYILKGVLHDWDDSHAEDILKACRKSMGPSSRLLIIERVAPGELDLATCLMDLHMLVVHGGRERTAIDFERLLTGASLTLVQLLPTKSGLSIIEAAPSGLRF